MSELEDIRKRKLEQLKEHHERGGKSMEKNLPNTPLHITDADFDKQVNTYDIIVIDCWAPWCGPCRMIAPVIEELAKEMQGKITFGKLNVDENQATSMKYNIMSIPTLLVFKKGKLVDQFVGAFPKDVMKKKLEHYF